ncbi:MAG: hypothetical protein ACJ739_11275 [Acidimicrobiales bacterium]
MSDELESLRAEVQSLRADLERERERERDERHSGVTRRGLIAGLAGFGAATVASVAGAESAAAADGDPLTLGQANSSEGTTSLVHEPLEAGAAVDVRSSGGVGIYATTDLEHPPLLVPSRAIYAVATDNIDIPHTSHAIGAQAGQGSALEGINESSVSATVAGANRGTAPGLAAVSWGHGPQLLLLQEDDAPSGPPTEYALAGAIRFDGDGELWLCTATTPEPAWTRLLREDTASGRVVPIDPMRALDTRATGGRASGSPAVPGQKKGPLHGGEAITLDLAGAGPVPADASGVVGNLTIVKPNYSGYLVAVPSGSASKTSAVNFDAGEVVANAFTSRLGPAGLTLRANGGSGNSYHLVVDITAYIT